MEWLRQFEAVGRTVIIHGVIRDDPAIARAAWDETARVHGIVGWIGADGGDRGLSVGGPPRMVADYVSEYRAIGGEEVVVVFREPFDMETIERLDEVRRALDDTA